MRRMEGKGVSDANIAKALHRTVNAVKCMRACGEGIKHGRRLSDADTEELLNLWLDGKSARAIAAELGRKTRTVTDYLTRHYGTSDLKEFECTAKGERKIRR